MMGYVCGCWYVDVYMYMDVNVDVDGWICVMEYGWWYVDVDVDVDGGMWMLMVWCVC